MEKLLRDWASGHTGRHIDVIETREHAPPYCVAGCSRWMPLDEDEQEDSGDEEE